MKEAGNMPRKAVALRYRPEQDHAPKVVAKGKGRLAEKIIAKANENGVPVQEDPSLVEILYKIDLDQAIPPELYRVVAEILALVYRMEEKGRITVEG